jgi:6,7-dimethyl-8-ribityllumazine synthase
MSKHKIYPQKQLEDLTAGDFRYAIVAARFNEAVVTNLLQAAVDTLQQHGAVADKITVVRVPGAFEIPLACQKLARTGKYDAIIALGCVIRGDTPHFDYVCSTSAHGILEVSLKFDMPIIYGVLTTDTQAQAEARAGDMSAGQNKGSDAAKSAMEMLAMLTNLNRKL